MLEYFAAEEGEETEEPAEAESAQDQTDHNGRYRDQTGIEKTHDVDAEQPGDDHIADRNGHGLKQVIVLGHVKRKAGAEYAAEGSEDDCRAAADQIVQPVQFNGHQLLTQAYGKEGKHSDQI